MGVHTAAAKLVDNVITFITLADYVWHEYDLNTGKITDRRYLITDKDYLMKYESAIYKDVNKKEYMVKEGTVSLDTFLHNVM